MAKIDVLQFPAVRVWYLPNLVICHGLYFAWTILFCIACSQDIIMSWWLSTNYTALAWLYHFFSVYRFIYETEKFNGVGELLEILGRLVIYCAIVFWYQLKIMSFRISLPRLLEGWHNLNFQLIPRFLLPHMCVCLTEIFLSKPRISALTPVYYWIS